MKIILNLVAGTTGGQVTRAEAFIKRFSQVAPDVNLVVFRCAGTMSSIRNQSNIEIRDVYIRNGFLRPFLRIIWENTKMVDLLNEYNGDVYLSFSHYLPVKKLTLPAIIAVSNLAPFDSRSIKVESLYAKIRLLLLKKSILSSAKKAQKVIALSAMCQRVLISNGIQSRSIKVIPNGVDFNISNDAKKSQSKGNYILSVSHFYRYKNYQHLLEAYAKLPKKTCVKFRLKIVGNFYDRKYVKELIELSESLGIESYVDFIQGVRGDELNKMYANASLFVFTSLIENSPNVLLEAMAHGLPIISTNCDPMPEFGDDALEYVECNNVSQLTKKIEYLLFDQVLTQKLSQSAKQRSKLYSWDNFFKEVFQLCLDSHQRK